MKITFAMKKRYYAFCMALACIFLAAVMFYKSTKQSWDLVRYASIGDVRTVTHMLNSGCDPNVKTLFGGGSALRMAVYYNHMDVARVLLVHNADSTEGLWAAITTGNAAAAEMMIHFHADVNCRLQIGMTPIKYASQMHNDKIVNMLRKGGGKE